jgi:hypothetical protein
MRDIGFEVRCDRWVMVLLTVRVHDAEKAMTVASLLTILSAW